LEAGTPELYYLNLSDNLWKITSMWRVVENEERLVLTIDYDALGDLVMTRFDGKFINIEVEEENKEKAARFEHKYGMKKFIIEMNPNFLELGITSDPTIRPSSGIHRMFITKLKLKESGSMSDLD
ncbi:hypothetical protein MKX03_004465, partial [Papaver bracteatum]